MCDHEFPGKVCLPDPAFLDGEPVIALDANSGDVVIGGPVGGAGHRGRLIITDADANPTFSVDGAVGEISQSGDIVLLDTEGNERIRITGQGAEIVIKNAAGDPVMCVGSQGDLEAGGGGEAGKLVVKNAAGNDTILMDGDEGDIVVQRQLGGAQREVLKFDASRATLHVGSRDNEGDIFVRNNAGQVSFQVDGNEGDIIVKREIDGTLRQVMKFDAGSASLDVGCKGNPGDISVRDGDGRRVLRFSARSAGLLVGANGNAGDLTVQNNAGQNSFQVDGSRGDIFVRREIDGTLREVMRFDASDAALYLGCEGSDGDLIVRDEAGNERIRLDGHTGDIRLRGADCAEQFEVAEPETIEPGTVLVIDNDSGLRPCDQPYDRKVAGVVSGAKGYSPGIVLDDSLAPNKRVAVALNGKVFCKVDAGFSAIEVGDLLTTSPIVGHAMKATDRSKAFGAVIGKALGSLDTGCGFIPVLVSLQ